MLFRSSSLVACEWCKSPSATGGPKDHLVFVLPGIALMYIAVLVAVGVLTAGQRLRWRSWAVWSLAAAAMAEVYVRLSYVGIRATAVTMVRPSQLLPVHYSADPPGQLHSQLHAARFAFFALLLTLSFFAPCAPTPDPRLSTSTTYLAPTLAALTAQTEALVNRLRAVSLQRMALLHDGDSRDKVRFYSVSSSTGALTSCATDQPLLVRRRARVARRQSGPGRRRAQDRRERRRSQRVWRVARRGAGRQAAGDRARKLRPEGWRLRSSAQFYWIAVNGSSSGAVH